MASINRAKVIELMGRKGITTFKSLAEALGISTTQLSNILSEKYEPIKSNIIELADFLGVDPVVIIEGESNEKEND